jgi:hypothetical protein
MRKTLPKMFDFGHVTWSYTLKWGKISTFYIVPNPHFKSERAQISDDYNEYDIYALLNEPIVAKKHGQKWLKSGTHPQKWP